ncbi:MAG: hypothetical protein IT361_07705 [Gemmatimonadaceae bacterium]|nr:hypothetical protein [Gemmatimonadaceae bacterium]
MWCARPDTGRRYPLQYVRCDACGAKALFAASRCPRCTHAFFLRDHRGGMVPLSHCRKCDTYYPKSVGGCKWCGTEASPSFSRTGIFAIAGLIAVAIAALVYFQGYGRRAASGGPADPAAPASESVLVSPPPSSTIAAVDTVVPGAEPVDSLPDDSAVAPIPAAAVAVTTAPAVATIPLPPGAGLPTTVRWTPARALTYINVRSGADRKAPVVGVVTPNMAVELGARFHGWREVRAAGLRGWADPRNFSSDSSTPR